MPKTNHLTLYRRHAGGCSIQDSKEVRKCTCVLWVHGKLHGKFVRRSLDTRALGEAESRVAAMLAEPPQGPSGGPQLVPTSPDERTLEQAAQEFYKAKSGNAQQAQRVYHYSIEHFKTYVERRGLTRLAAIESAHIRDWLRDQPTWKRANTRRNHLTNLRVFFTFCKDEGWIKVSPAANKQLSISRPAGARRPFTDDEVKRILTAVERLQEPERATARAIVLLLLYSGMRICDATFCERASITAEGILKYWQIKSHHEIAQEIELQPPAMTALAALPASSTFYFVPNRADGYRAALKALKNGEQGFDELIGKKFYDQQVRRLSNLMAKVLRLAGVEGSCHKFRNTFAVNMLMAGVDVYTVSLMLGHTDVETTRTYLNFVKEQRMTKAQATRGLSYNFPLAVVAS